MPRLYHAGLPRQDRKGARPSGSLVSGSDGPAGRIGRNGPGGPVRQGGPFGASSPSKRLESGVPSLGAPMSRDRESRRISTLIFYGTVLLLAWLAYRIVEPFLVQIGWAVVLAICLDPIQARLRPRLGPTRTALLLTALVVVLLVLPVAFAGTALVGEGQQAVSDIRSQLEDEGGAAAWLHTGWEWLRGSCPSCPTSRKRSPG